MLALLLAQEVSETSGGGLSFRLDEFINAFGPALVTIGTLLGAAFAAFRVARKKVGAWIEEHFPGHDRGATETDLDEFKEGLKEVRAGVAEVEKITKQHDANQRENIRLTTERLNGVDRQLAATRETVESRANSIEKRVETVEMRCDDLDNGHRKIIEKQEEILDEVKSYRRPA